MKTQREILKPNFFIIGGPRCGTTALSEYLREHPRIFVSKWKELHFFDQDLGGRSTRFRSLEDYLGKSFGEAEPGRHLAIGEATPTYLFSRVAVPSILKFSSDAKFIVLLRNPVEQVCSWHNNKVFTGEENQHDLKTAWGLQEVRMQGESIPPFCKDPVTIQYGAVAKLGAQMERLYRLVNPERVKVIFFEDFQKDTKGVYEEILLFLGVPSDGREHFPIINASQRSKHPLIFWFLQFTKHPLLRKLPSWIKNERVMVFLATLKAKNTGFAKRPPLDRSFRRQLQEYFREDILLLQRLLRRDLSSWLSET